MANENSKKIRQFTDLVAWQQGHELVQMIYEVTESFPSEEKFCLVNQMRRAVVSVTNNVAEGFSRESYAEKIRFYNMSLSSLSELQNQLLIARATGILDEESFSQVNQKIIRVRKLLIGLIKKSKELRNS